MADALRYVRSVLDETRQFIYSHIIEMIPHMP
jgi:hypothetical protein